MRDPAISRLERRRLLVLCLALLLGFGVIAGQLARLGLRGDAAPRMEAAQSLGRLIARPDIVDRHGRLLATDIVTHSLFADPSRIRDLDEALEQLKSVLPDLDVEALRRNLANRARRFVWIERELTPTEAKRVLDLGLPGLDFRAELTRAYPSGDHEGHLLGFVDGDYRGKGGIERYVDEAVGVEAVEGPVRSSRPPLRLSIDLAVQHALRSELAAALARYGAAAAGAVVMDARSGEVLAIASLPDFAAGDARASLDASLIDRMAAGSYELGSVFKAVTLAVATELGIAGAERRFDAREPLAIGAATIDDSHPDRRLLSAEDVFLHSSNIGAARMAIEIGEPAMRKALRDLDLDRSIATEIGPLGRAQLPLPWTPTSLATISFGHGIAVSPLAFAGAVAALVADGHPVRPTFILRGAGAETPGRVLSEATVHRMRELFRANVERGTGRRAAVPGYDVGGKTGTADIPGRGGYGREGVIASFVAAFPMSSPRYIVYTVLWQPNATEATDGERTAAYNAAPTSAAIIARVAPILGLSPRLAAAP